MKYFRQLVFRQIQLKLITTASISCLSHPSMSLTTWLMSYFETACLWTFTHFFILHRDISEKLQDIKILKFSVFHTSLGTSSLPSMNKIGDGRVFSLVHLTWNDPVLKHTGFISVAYPDIFSGVGVQQIQLRTEGRENGDLGAVAP
jgi:hypothetical protein